MVDSVLLKFESSARLADLAVQFAIARRIARRLARALPENLRQEHFRRSNLVSEGDSHPRSQPHSDGNSLVGAMPGCLTATACQQ